MKKHSLPLITVAFALFLVAIAGVRGPRALAQRTELKSLGSVFDAASGGVRDTNGDGLADSVVARVRSRLDRTSLKMIAAAGGGQYFELDQGTDPQIANAIIDATRRRSGTRGLEETTEDLYWRFLLASAGFVLLGCLFLRDRVALWTQLAGAAAALGVLAVLLK